MEIKYPQSLRRKVGTACKIYHFVGELLMILSTSFSETSLKCDRLVGGHMCCLTFEEEAGNMSQIL